MSKAAVQMFVARAIREEGLKIKPYDDATSKPVEAPVGNLSWGIGFNLMQCGSLGLFSVMLNYLAGLVDAQLSVEMWYAQASDARQSAFLDVAYNAGVAGELQGFPQMIKFAGLKDWISCAAECKVANVSLDKSRYAPLRAIILQG